MPLDDYTAAQVLKLAQCGREGLRVHPPGWNQSWHGTIFVDRIEEETEFAIWALNPEIAPYKHHTMSQPTLFDCIGAFMRKMSGVPGAGSDFKISDAEVEMLESFAAAHQPAVYAEAVAVELRQLPQ